MLKTNKPFFNLPAFGCFIFTLVILISSVQAQEKILVMGDSISAAYRMKEAEGWVAHLQRKLNQEGFNAQVVNASVSGETSGGGLNRLPKLLAAHEPDLVVIELGGNDGLRGQPIKRMKANLEKMISLSQKSGAKVVLAGMQIPPNYGPVYTYKFANAYKELSNNYEVPLIPFLLEGVATNRAFMQRDGIHPNVKGQPLILKNAWPTISGSLGS